MERIQHMEEENRKLKSCIENNTLHYEKEESNLALIFSNRFEISKCDRMMRPKKTGFFWKLSSFICESNI